MGRPRKNPAPEQALPAGSLDSDEAEKLPDGVARITDVSQITPEQLAKLLQDNADLQARLAKETEARTEAEQKLVDQATAQLSQEEIREVPTGKHVNVRRLDVLADGCEDRAGYKTVGYKDDQGGRPILKPVFKSVRLPTFYYRIDLAPAGGEFFSINGQRFYHGTIGEFDIDQLRSVKEIVARGWAHEASIRGSNENAYRQQKRPSISARTV